MKTAEYYKNLLIESKIHLQRYADLIPMKKEWDYKAQSLDDFLNKIKVL